MDRFRTRAKALRAGETSAEAWLWRALRGRRLGHRKFRRQHPILRYVVDVACIEAKLVIEIDGATHGTDAELARDAQRTRELEAAGFHFIRFMNHDVFRNLEGVLETILAQLEYRDHL